MVLSPLFCIPHWSFAGNGTGAPNLWSCGSILKPMSKAKAQMSNQAQNPSSKRKYDLEERTAQLGERIIEFARTLPPPPGEEQEDLSFELWNLTFICHFGFGI